MKQEKTFSEEYVENLKKDQKREARLKNATKVFAYAGLISIIVGPLIWISSVIGLFADKKYDAMLDEKSVLIEEFTSSNFYTSHLEEETEKYKNQFLNDEISAHQFQEKVGMLKDSEYISELAAKHDPRVEDCNKRLNEQSSKYGAAIGAGVVAATVGAAGLVLGGLTESVHYDCYGPVFKDRSLLGKFYKSNHRKRWDYDEANISGV